MNQTAKWVTKNYDWIDYWSKKWSWDNHGDLVSHLYFYLDKNWDKFSKIPDNDERKKFIQIWFKNTTRWSKSDFNKSIEVNNLPENYEIEDTTIDNHIELITETDIEDIKDWLIYITNTWSEDGALKLIKLRKIYLELDTPNKVLWDLYFTKMMSMRQIAAQLDLPLSAVYNMLNELKKEVLKKC